MVKCSLRLVTNNMIANDLQNRAPSIWVSEDISGMVDTFSLSLQATGMDEVNASFLAPSGVLSGICFATGGGTTSDIHEQHSDILPLCGQHSIRGAGSFDWYLHGINL